MPVNFQEAGLFSVSSHRSHSTRPAMDLSELCIRRPVLTTLVTATFIVFGLFAYRLLGVAALPSVDFPTIVINTNLPGASAETMASSVAAPIERQLSTISGISALT